MFKASSCLGQPKGRWLCVAVLSAGLLAPASSFAQGNLTALLQSISLAFSPGGTLPATVTLNGNAVRTAGAPAQSGTVQLTSGSDGSLTETWALPVSPTAVSASSLSGSRSCSYTDAKGTHTSTAVDCLRSVPWFSPWLTSSLLSTSLTSAAYATTAADLAAGQQRITYTTVANFDPSTSSSDLATIHRATSVDVLYSAATFLPAAVEYTLGSSSDGSGLISVRVVFSNYSAEGAIVVPHHIQRYIQRTLQDDIQITNVSTQ